MKRTSILAPALLALALAAPAAAQTLHGRVVDARTGEPLAQATVTALLGNRTVGRTRSAEDGTFTMDLRNRDGVMRVRAERLGFRTTLSDTLTVGMRERVEVSLRMSTEALAIAPLTVTARREPRKVRGLEMQGFYEREAAGFGRFMRREDFADRTRDMAHLLSREPSMHITVDALGKAQVFFNRSNVSPYERHGFATLPPRAGRLYGASGSRDRLSNTPCQPRFYVDGIPQLVSRDITVNELISPDQVEAVEFYRGPAETPVRFQGGDTTCGVVVIWSRSDGGEESGGR